MSAHPHAAGPAAGIPVWDPLVRILHWTLAAAVIVAYATGDHGGAWHEFAVLEALIAHPGRTLTRRQLEERLYAWGREVESNAIEVHVHHLRAKLYPELIRTVRSVGYVIDA